MAAGGAGWQQTDHSCDNAKYEHAESDGSAHRVTVLKVALGQDALAVDYVISNAWTT